MHKYREQTVRLLQGNRVDKMMSDRDTSDKNPTPMSHMMDKVVEMAGVMQEAIKVDESSACEEQKRISQLELENKGLRELLEICTTSRERIVPAQQDVTAPKVESTTVDEDDDETTDTEENSSIVAAPDATSLPEAEDKDTATEKEVSSTADKESSAATEKEFSAAAATEKEASAAATEKEASAAATKDVEKDKEKEKEKVKPTATPDDKTKKKKSPESGRKVAGTTGKAVGASKSAGDIRKGRVTSAPGKSDSATGTSTVKKSASGSLIKKETNAASKSPSLDGKKTIKGKTPPRTVSGTLTKK